MFWGDNFDFDFDLVRQVDKWAFQVDTAPRRQHIRALLDPLLPGCQLGR